ncbi:MAG: kelch repeat-containing protein [Planctomycetota bacterium]|nr:kelch repeat-containing protein [Planctomycetota bacterium]
MSKPIHAASLALAGLLLLTPLAAAEAKLVRTGGVIGGSLTYTIDGDPFELFALLPSTTAGPTPLSLLDPLDGRSLDVGLDLLSVMVVGSLGASGTQSVVFPLTTATSLVGVPIYAQAMTIPGMPTVVDEISNVTSFVLGMPGDSHLAIGELSLDTAAYSSVGLDDGRVLLGGGSTTDLVGNTIPSSSLRVFEPQTQTFTDLAANLTYATIAPAVVKLADGRVLFSGGLGAGDTVLTGASIFDPMTGSSSAAANMGTPRTQHTATLLADGRVFVTGGVKAVDAADPIAGLGDILKTSEVYDPVANSWSSAASMSLPRVGHQASLLPSGRVLITGGLEIGSLFGIPIPSIVNTAMRYNPVNNSMIGTASMSGSRALHGQVTLSDGRALVVGGADGDVLTQNFSSLSTCRTYNEGTNSWTNVTSLPEVRTFPNLVELAGEVHVISGLGTIDVLTLTGNPVLTIAKGDLGTFGWTTVGTMVHGRPLSAAIAIEGGERVLVVGPGDNGTAAFDRSAEVYIP